MSDLTVLMTGATGLLGRALTEHLADRPGTRLLAVGRSSSDEERCAAVTAAHRVLHLAGVTRAADPAEFTSGNIGTTEKLAEVIARTGRVTPIAFASSIRASEPTIYGQTKRAAEDILIRLAERTDAPLAVFRLPSFFGVWSRPDYNSAIATFCHDALQGRPSSVRHPDASITLVHLDDVVRAFDAWIGSPAPGVTFPDVGPTYSASVGEAARLIHSFTDPKNAGAAAEHESGLVRGLYQTFRAHQER